MNHEAIWYNQIRCLWRRLFLLFFFTWPPFWMICNSKTNARASYRTFQRLKHETVGPISMPLAKEEIIPFPIHQWEQYTFTCSLKYKSDTQQKKEMQNCRGAFFSEEINSSESTVDDYVLCEQAFASKAKRTVRYVALQNSLPAHDRHIMRTCRTNCGARLWMNSPLWEAPLRFGDSRPGEGDIKT